MNEPKPPLRIYKGVTFIYGDPPEQIYTEQESYDILSEIVAQLERENAKLRKELVAEREACALVAEEHGCPVVAARIRARKNSP